ncbi:tRNA (N6-isopentenyl adenosine(37)-C2)-methylthiotransferase MiaB [Desulfotomaculum copahuensis]|uniref:tRNA-2-methylthio-N(6)-dimethylallyladenosine synthase n=1 Tax=Desulfotomaculum copahuensis TaxID=1838280 RepID=A0A1B7LE95_9FIRM|nr:tRNA (N6-isopentenyl adenosine(37)-C2)-methylthiotransferase MiaB [Desulfotomaculum copahuensis]OAT81406.1 tRNA (N6-isopentenyl adenosine(37)-C2)-methylthiotransferase MiaB [Desulfotomaculum copahuensis]
MSVPQTYAVISFGCQMNDHDSEVMAGMLEAMGYREASAPEEAGVILVNTCCVRETAENKVFGLLGRLCRLKAARPGMLIGIAGCMIQQKGMAGQIRQRFPAVDLIFGTHNLHRLPELLAQAGEAGRTVAEIWPQAGAVREDLPVRRTPGVRAWVNISYGCNNFCTYCIVPYVRGRERSRRAEDILNEIRRLVEQGYREVTLLGQNVNSYGKDLPGEASFAGLLAAVNEVPGLARIRFMTSHPRDFSDRLVETIAGCSLVCEHIHLPVQAGSDRVLKMMHRGYDRAYYLALVDRIRRALPGAALSTDIMAGFPGETEEDFAQTMDLVERVRFAAAFTFIYNRRPGTPAADMPGQVPEDVKRDRIQRLIARQNEISLALNRERIGAVEEILVEGTSKTNPRLLSGRTRTNRLTFFPGPPVPAGRLVPVKITGATLTHLEGVPAGGGE